MRNHFFDYDDGDYCTSTSGDTAIDSDGNMMMRMGDHLAMDMDSGELHITSGWNDEDDTSYSYSSNSDNDDDLYSFRSHNYDDD